MNGKFLTYWFEIYDRRNRLNVKKGANWINANSPSPLSSMRTAISTWTENLYEKETETE